MSIIIGI